MAITKDITHPETLLTTAIHRILAVRTSYKIDGSINLTDITFGSFVSDKATEAVSTDSISFFEAPPDAKEKEWAEGKVVSEGNLVDGKIIADTVDILEVKKNG